MDASEPSTNGTSACNLYRLSSFLNDDTYTTLANETLSSFESEILQYPWLFASFMPAIVARRLGVRGVVVAGGAEEVGVGRIKEFEKAPRGALGSFIMLGAVGESWIRGRNTLLGQFGVGSEEVRVLICEGGVCREESVNGGAGLGSLMEVGNALPVAQSGSEVEKEQETPVVLGQENKKPE